MRHHPSYHHQTYERLNPLARFAHERRYGVSLATAARLLAHGGTVVDFGAGDGAFVHRLGLARPDAQRVAIEPLVPIRYPEIRRVAAFAELDDGSCELVTALEVLEHLEDDDLAKFVAEAGRVLRPGGRLLVTVPVMYGLALPLKELSRMFLLRAPPDARLGEIARATVGLPIARTRWRQWSHAGFDFRALRQRIAACLELAEENYSPFPWLPWWLNSQAIFVARRTAS